MALYRAKKLDGPKMFELFKENIEESKERLALHVAIFPVLQKYLGKRPTAYMKTDIKAAIGDDKYIVSGPKDYSLQHWRIYGRNTHAKDPAYIKKYNQPWSRIKSGYSVTIKMGHLNNHNLTEIQQEHVDEEARRIKQIRDELLAHQRLTQFPEGLNELCNRWNSALDELNKLQNDAGVYSLGHLFSDDWYREHDVYKD